MIDLHSVLHLQLFAEAAGNTGDTAPDAGVQGVKPQAETADLPMIEDPEAEFDRLIRGQFKDQYNARVQDIVRKRLKSQEKTLEQYKALETTLQEKFGIQAKEPQSLEQVFQQWEADAAQQYHQWMQQAQQAKTLYPALNMAQEVKNPRFLGLLQSGVEVSDAYLITHRDEIIPSVMHYTAKAVEEKLANRIAANGARPSEGAMSGRGTTVVADQVSHMSKAQRQDIIRRVRQGEIIRF